MTRLCLTIGLTSSLLIVCGCAGVFETKRQQAPKARPSQHAELAAPAETAKAESDQEPAEKKDDEDPKLKRARLVRDLAIAKEKLAKAGLALTHQQADDQAELAQKAAEHKLAMTKLQDFEAHDAPQQLEEARLQLLRSEDWLKDAEEELAQLEMMYAEEDLADKTREIVLERGRRRLERARRDVALSHITLANLEEHSLPREAVDLRSQMTEKARLLENLQRAIEAHRLEKQIALMEAEAEVTRLEEEITKLDEKAKEAEETDE